MRRIAIALVALISIAASAVGAQTFTVRDIMREPSMTGMRPDSQRLSPDGSFAVFSWNAEGKEPRNLYMTPTNGIGSARMLVNAERNFEQRTTPPESKLNYGLVVRDDFVKAREKNLGGVDISPDSKRILFSQNSDIYILDVTSADATPRRVTRTQGFEGGARWLTDDSIIYSSGGNWFVMTLNEASVVQVTRESNPQAFASVFNMTTTKNATLAAYVVSDGSRQRALFVPNYLDEFVQVPSVRRGFTEQKVLVSRLDGSLERAFEVKLPKPEGAGYIRGLDWAADNSSLVVDRLDKDLKRRQIHYVTGIGTKEEKSVLVTEETDDKWIAPLSRIVEPHPSDRGTVMFTSERDGFNHIYLAKLDGERFETSQITRGAFEVDWAKWDGSGDAIVYSSTEKGTAERQFFEYIIAAGERYQVTLNQPGMKNSPQMESGGGRPVLLYEASTWNTPSDLYAISVCTRCRGIAEPVRLTESAPAAFMSMKWNAPKFVDIPTRDGKTVKTKMYFPENFDAEVAEAKRRKRAVKKYPMVIFVHGAGYLQNTINGWNNYYREFMFNQMMTRKGYVVLDIDFRGSAGYGRDWRTDVHDFLGGKDYEDHLDAIDYAVKNYNVDPARVGAYGGSYGGFMAGMLVMRAPDKIAAAAALRPVFDWKNYFAANPTYTAERLGMPDKNPEAYKRSSPIAYAEELKKPLLILHGLVDDNVHAQDSIQLIEKLMRLGKTRYFEAMLYPSENHGFVRPTSWADEYERIEVFFDRYLKY